MKHVYLSEAIVNDALLNKAITEQEAVKLIKKITYQAGIFRAINK